MTGCKRSPHGGAYRALAVLAVAGAVTGLGGTATAVGGPDLPGLGGFGSVGSSEFGPNSPMSCGLSSVSGSFGATGRGNAVGRGFLVAVGIVAFDGKGGFESVRTVHNGPTVIPDHHVVGTYTIDNDCTGSMVYTNADAISGGTTTHLDFVVDRNGTEIRMVGTDPGFATLIEGTKQFVHSKPQTCSTATLHGRFGATGSGTDAAGEPLYAAVGTIEFDGRGNYSNVRSISMNGQIVPKSTVTGTYTLDENCTGFVEYVSNGIPAGQVKRNYIVVSNDGRELRAVGLDSSLLDTIVGVKQSW